VNENIEATGFSNVSKDTFDVYPAFGPAIVEAGECTVKAWGGSMPDAEGLPDTEGLEFSVLTALWAGDARGKLGTSGTGGIGEG
jgi:hypothetical protein